MIAKHVPMRSLGKSDFAGLVAYIMDAQSKTERVDLVRQTNCEAGTVEAAVIEVLATQHSNTRAASDKTFHLLVSFRAGENPDEKTLAAIEHNICDGLGFGEHQRISAVHRDTDNVHIHIAINKIHPTRLTIHDPHQSYRTLGGLCEALEVEYKLERDNHEAGRSIAEGRAADMERHAGVQSLVGWIRRECLDEIQKASTWAELHRSMRENGLELKARGNGFAIQADDGTMAKASTVSRDLSKASLEARLGAYEPAADQSAESRRRYAKQPVPTRINTAPLYVDYQRETQTLAAIRKEKLSGLKDAKDREIEAVLQGNRARRSAIKLLRGNPLVKKALYAQAHKAMREKIEEINKKHQEGRGALYQSYGHRQWADWLKIKAQQGNEKALEALRAREARQGLKGDTIQAKGQAKGPQSGTIDTVTKKGTIIYRAGKSAVRDDGDRLQVSRGSTQEGLQQALKMAVERYGNQIIVNGTTEFKAKVIRAAAFSAEPITFADPVLETRRLTLIKREQEQRQQNEEKKPVSIESELDAALAALDQASLPPEPDQHPESGQEPEGPLPAQIQEGPVWTPPETSGSPTLDALDQNRRPSLKTECERCPNSVWFASPLEVKCYCRVMYLVVWSSKEPSQITNSDGVFLGQE
jgi:hypothetical protein